MHTAERKLRLDVAVRCSKSKQSPCLDIVLRPAVFVAVHAAERGLSIGVTLLCSEPKEPPRLCKVLPGKTTEMHAAKHTLRCCVALRCSELKQPTHLCKVLRPAFAVEVHAGEQRQRVGIEVHANQPPLFARWHAS